MTKTTLLRPEVLPAREVPVLAPDVTARSAAKQLLDGARLELNCDYSRGAEILDQIAALSPALSADASYNERTVQQRVTREAQLRLRAPIERHRVALRNARPIGFLKELYPNINQFSLPFPEIQALHGSWIKYSEGSHLPVLGHKIHPFYGTYVPRRTSHLELFGTWLSAYTGKRDHTIDVGTGCGVLALMLNKAGFQRVTATDCNPNALESLRRDLQRQKLGQNFTLVETDLLDATAPNAEVIVFNPPWIQGSVDSFLDRALYYDDDLFERFFDKATQKLAPQGRVVIIFSTILQLLQPKAPHPILRELERGRFHLVNKMQRRVKSDKSRNTPHRRTKERVEIWELALT